jgi:hypothetical protein
MLNNLVLKENGDEFVGYGNEQNWTHKCALWELPYAKALILMHNIDIMHQERNFGESILSTCIVIEPPREGVRHQDQLERFSVKREHNQHIIVHYHIIHSSKSYYNLGSRIRYTKRFEAKTMLQRLIRVCGTDFSLGQDIPFLP